MKKLLPEFPVKVQEVENHKRRTMKKFSKLNHEILENTEMLIWVAKFQTEIDGKQLKYMI